MEGYLTNYYEYHSSISAISTSRVAERAGHGLMKLFFIRARTWQQWPETIAYVNRSRRSCRGHRVAVVMRFDTGSVPVGYLVLRSDTRSVAESTPGAVFVRPTFCSLPGVSARRPFGVRCACSCHCRSARLKSYGMRRTEVG